MLDPIPTPPTPHRLTRIAETLHLASLCVWLGAVVMSGVVAAVIFPLMRTLDPTLGAYPSFTGDHSNLAAGRIAARVFLISDAAQFASATLALATMALLLVRGAITNRRWGHGVRVVSLAFAITTLSYHLMILGPRMDTSLHNYWAAAAAGDNAAAETARLAFSDDHPKASRSLGILAVSVGVCLVSGLWAVQVPHTPSRRKRLHTKAEPVADSTDE
ncbi:MAG: hypothetical protein ACI89L_000492 [Phycisphaerales bacterium]|jgi:hypothetical protein